VARATASELGELGRAGVRELAAAFSIAALAFSRWCGSALVCPSYIVVQLAMWQSDAHACVHVLSRLPLRAVMRSEPLMAVQP